MKWFKHMTASWNDERLASLIDHGGKDGLARYGAYWRICEIVASRGHSVTFPVQRWAELLALSEKVAVQLIVEIADAKLIICRIDEFGISVKIPDLVGGNSMRLPWPIWSAIRQRIFARDNNICRYCGRYDPRPECDHVIPLSRGGSDHDENLVTACQSCNRRKGGKLAQEIV